VKVLSVEESPEDAPEPTDLGSNENED